MQRVKYNAVGFAIAAAFVGFVVWFVLSEAPSGGPVPQNPPPFTNGVAPN